MIDRLLLLGLVLVVLVQWWLLLGLDAALKEIRHALNSLHEEIRIPSSPTPVRTRGEVLHEQA